MQNGKEANKYIIYIYILKMFIHSLSSKIVFSFNFFFFFSFSIFLMYLRGDMDAFKLQLQMHK